jgi:hypothetical protein
MNDEDRQLAEEIITGQRAEVERLRKELEREKEEHDRCTTFHAIAVKERNYERVLALHRDTEIKRLRGLLREGITVPVQLNANALSPVAWRKDYQRRVREALGDD